MEGTLVAMLLAAVSAEAAAPEPIRGEAALGELVSIGPVRVKPLSIVEDSRCPKATQCAQAGRIVVRTELRERSTRKTRDFVIGQWRQVEQGGAIMLSEAAPAPEAGATIDPKAYRFTYKFQR